MDRFQNNIQKWVEVDNKLKKLNEEIFKMHPPKFIDAKK